MANKIMENISMGRMKVERPRYSCMDSVLDDIKILNITNWWVIASNREINLEKNLKALTRLWKESLKENIWTHPKYNKKLCHCYGALAF